MKRGVYLEGSLETGFTAKGPYDDFDEAAIHHEGDEGQILELHPPDGEEETHGYLMFPKVLAAISEQLELSREQWDKLTEALDMDKGDIEEIFADAILMAARNQQELIDNGPTCDECGRLLEDTEVDNDKNVHGDGDDERILCDTCMLEAT